MIEKELKQRASMPETVGVENKLPVFTVPSQQITFYADDPSTHKQVLTIFNPYEFAVRFRVLISSLDCSKYTVSVSQGIIKPQHSVEIILQHKAVLPINTNVTDKMRVQIIATGQMMLAGRKDILITLLPTSPRERFPSSSIEQPERFQQLEADKSGLSHLRQNPLLLERRGGELDTLPNSILLQVSHLLVAFILGVFAGYYWKS